MEWNLAKFNCVNWLCFEEGNGQWVGTRKAAPSGNHGNRNGESMSVITTAQKLKETPVRIIAWAGKVSLPDFVTRLGQEFLHSLKIIGSNQHIVGIESRNRE